MITDTDRLNFLLQFIHIDDIFGFGDSDWGVVVEGIDMANKLSFGPATEDNTRAMVVDLCDDIRDVIDRAIIAHKWDITPSTPAKSYPHIIQVKRKNE